VDSSNIDVGFANSWVCVLLVDDTVDVCVWGLVVSPTFSKSPDPEPDRVLYVFSSNVVAVFVVVFVLFPGDVNDTVVVCMVVVVVVMVVAVVCGTKGTNVGSVLIKQKYFVSVRVQRAQYWFCTIKSVSLSLARIKVRRVEYSSANAAFSVTYVCGMYTKVEPHSRSLANMLCCKLGRKLSI
jgi:hypothetical protein